MIKILNTFKHNEDLYTDYHDILDQSKKDVIRIHDINNQFIAVHDHKYRQSLEKK
jgi:hypothetical protein